MKSLVRGAVFNELDVRALRSDLMLVGNDPLVSNRQGSVATTVITPSLLFDELEVKRADTSKDKLPDYPAPPLQSQTAPVTEEVTNISRGAAEVIARCGVPCHSEFSPCPPYANDWNRSAKRRC